MSTWKKCVPCGYKRIARMQAIHIRGKAQKFVVRGGEMYFKKKKKGKVCSF